MHPIDEPAANAPAEPTRPWYGLLTKYHWFVLGVAALGWLFDCLDQQLFVLARPAAMKALVTEAETPAQLEIARSKAGDYATSIFMIGWAIGGLFFGVLGDRIGRSKTMLLTILLYSLFTGLSAFSQGFWDFALFRFLTGLGVGGEFAVGVALVAETMPALARPYCLGLLQACSAFGNIAAALINLRLGIAEEHNELEFSAWRIMFVVGALPALLTIIIRVWLKEPEQWRQVASGDAVGKQLGSYRELFSDPLWRKHALLGLVLGCAGIIGLWSVGFFVPDLIRTVQRKRIEPIMLRDYVAKIKVDEGDSKASEVEAVWESRAGGKKLTASEKEIVDPLDKQISGAITSWQSYTSLMINIGAFFGMFGFGAMSQHINRKTMFMIAQFLAFVSTVAVCWFLDDLWQIFVLVPIMGFCQLSLFAGYAIYFPELFPTRLRSTGTSFCYNVGRLVAALGPLVKAGLTDFFRDTPEPQRYAGVTMCLVFLVGYLVLPFLPETKGKPLPE